MTCKFQPGDIFGIPLPDASMGIGQILSLEPDALNSVGCVFFAATARPSGFTGVMEPISVLLVTPDLLKSGVWPVKSQGPVFLEPEERPYEIYRASHWVGVRVTGSGIVQEFLAAYHGLTPWDAWHDPHYLDSLLLPGVERPAHVVLSARASCSHHDSNWLAEVNTISWPE